MQVEIVGDYQLKEVDGTLTIGRFSKNMGKYSAVKIIELQDSHTNTYKKQFAAILEKFKVLNKKYQK